LIQTPQTFQTRILKQAYDKALHENYTDDAAVLEAADHNIHLVEGEYTNIKITTPEDLMVAEAFIKAKKDSQNL
jgi:2-C-methyl-D-erythritol 4-phosphate cytidylyltransferase